ncbi:hypothetical protein CFAM422_006169 [Trichoderma lentiforme]|uniref:Uncharacterized protein n=1 Tax=Trichoderma lentiforme TaxID=1567552 RepID=A0A9P4XFP3_9HYPO|nr:hypothetical protein CFAM422_006169 [Trichoderma lentiforme]
MLGPRKSDKRRRSQVHTSPKVYPLRFAPRLSSGIRLCPSPHAAEVELMMCKTKEATGPGSPHLARGFDAIKQKTCRIVSKYKS